jgi:hypothetical protein
VLLARGLYTDNYLRRIIRRIFNNENILITVVVLKCVN